MSKTYEVENLINDLYRAHPVWPSTFSMCQCQREMGRGGGKCSLCIEEALGEILDPDLANEIHEAIKNLSNLKREAFDLAEKIQ